VPDLPLCLGVHKQSTSQTILYDGFLLMATGPGLLKDSHYSIS
jgi:hypothetical protein